MEMQSEKQLWGDIMKPLFSRGDLERCPAQGQLCMTVPGCSLGLHASPFKIYFIIDGAGGMA